MSGLPCKTCGSPIDIPKAKWTSFLGSLPTPNLTITSPTFSALGAALSEKMSVSTHWMKETSLAEREM